MSPSPPSFSIGLDLGTSSVRALCVDTQSGAILACVEHPYLAGVEGIVSDDRDPNIARQHPGDLLDRTLDALRGVVAHASHVTTLDPRTCAGIGVDSTGSTPLPLDANGTPLAFRPEFASEPAALAWLWKDHSAHAEAAEITEDAIRSGLPYLSRSGGVYSSEWYWSKLLRLSRTHPNVAEAAAAWIELSDYIVAALTGTTKRPARGVCAAGHKGLYDDSWGGLPAREFLDALHPGLSRFRESFASPAQPGGTPAAGLSSELALRVGLPAGTPVSVGVLDAHAGAIGSGVAPGVLVKILGTSACDCLVSPSDPGLIPGVAGIVPGSILPGMLGIEAGQPAVGDLFSWFARFVSEGSGETPDRALVRLTEAAQRLRPCGTGLLALDWSNGSRSPIMDPLLSGLIVGLSLRTSQADVFRTLVEATAFGAREIIDAVTRAGVLVERIVACGGIAEKSPFVMQVYADVTARRIDLAGAPHACALGAAILGAVAGLAHASVEAAQRAMVPAPSRTFRPDPDRLRAYEELRTISATLREGFASPNAAAPLFPVMKRLIDLRARACP